MSGEERPDTGHKHYEMLWDCAYCATPKLLGKSHRHCPKCGAPQDPERRYFPADSEKVAVEDHVPVGGLAGAVCEVLAERRPAPVLRIGVRGFGESGDPAELYDRFGLSAKRIAEATAGFLDSPAEVALAGTKSE